MYDCGSGALAILSRLIANPFNPLGSAGVVTTNWALLISLTASRAPMNIAELSCAEFIRPGRGEGSEKRMSRIKQQEMSDKRTNASVITDLSA